MEHLGLPFEVVKPEGINEEGVVGDSSYQIAQKIALAKAKSVAEKFPDAIVVAADTIVVFGEQILGKPKDRDDAIAMLHTLRGKWHNVITGVAIVRKNTDECLTDYEKTGVCFCQLCSSEIEAYVNTLEPMDKAGAYGIQGKGAFLVERINGCYFNVVGLPLAKLGQMLRKFGVYVLS
jgi:septum formation protein